MIILFTLKGYRILHRRFKTPLGEIDLVARRGNQLAFIEVKARTQEYMREVLTKDQCQRIIRAAAYYISCQSKLVELDMRFDLVIVKPWRIPYHLQDAWRPGWQ